MLNKAVKRFYQGVSTILEVLFLSCTIYYLIDDGSLHKNGDLNLSGSKAVPEAIINNDIKGFITELKSSVFPLSSYKGLKDKMTRLERLSIHLIYLG